MGRNDGEDSQKKPSLKGRLLSYWQDSQVGSSNEHILGPERNAGPTIS